MKKITIITIALLLSFVGSAYSLTIENGSIDVGGVDQLIAATFSDNSGESEELEWVETVLFQKGSILEKDSIYLTDKTESDDNDWAWYLTNQAYTYAFNLADEPMWYLIKTGNLKNAEGHNTFLYENISEFDWAVIDLSKIGNIAIINIGKVSHVTDFGTTPVPEPATMLLLGTGLVGLASISRKKFKN